MSAEIVRLGINDYEECLHFLKMSFNEYAKPLDFDRELPKAFRPRQDLMEQNLVIRSDRRILALVGVYPMDLNVDGTIIKAGTVGNVATHPEERGKGYMKTLFTEALKAADTMGLQMTRLGGLRQRYNRYGYDYAGSAYQYQFTKRNAAYYEKDHARRTFTFVPMNEETPELLQLAFDLYQRTCVHVDRLDPETFRCVLRAHFMEPWAALAADGTFAGYLIASEDGTRINEQYASDPSAMVDLTISWMEQQEKSSVSLYLKSWDFEANRLFGRYSEHFTMIAPSMFRIKDWQGVVEPFLRWKQKMQPLQSGKTVIEIQQEGTFELLVPDSGETLPSFQPTDQASELSADHLTATRLLCGMTPIEQVMDIPSEHIRFLRSTLPLPLSWSAQDNV